jgi:hypothetical protein
LLFGKFGIKPEPAEELFCLTEIFTEVIFLFTRYFAIIRWQVSENMEINFTPKTRAGKWAMRFTIAFAALYLVSVGIVGLTQKQINGEIIMDSWVQPFLAVFGISAIVCGILAFIFGMLSFIKYKEKTIFIYIALLVGFLVLSFILGEFLIPH